MAIATWERSVPLPLERSNDGVLRVRGTRITLDAIVDAYEHGDVAEEIVKQYPSLKLADIYLLIGYYLTRPIELEQYLKQRASTQAQNHVNGGSTQAPLPSERINIARDQVRQREFLTLVERWADYVKARKNLEAASFTRSRKPAEVEFAEWLVQFIFNGDPLPSKSNPNYDVIAGNKRIEVKSISKSKDNPNGYKIDKLRDKQNDPLSGATHYAFLFFEDFVPDALFLVPEDFVRNFPRGQIRRGDLESQPDSKVNIDLQPFANTVAASGY